MRTEYNLKLSKIPTGIEMIDVTMRGGIPSGYMAALVSEPGAGDFEFSITSIANLLIMKNKIEENIIIPGKVCYISLMRSKEDILKEIAFSFPDFYNVIIEAIHNEKFEFKDFSEIFLNGKINNNSFEVFSSENCDHNNIIIDSLIRYINEIGLQSLIFIDSLTVLAEYYNRNNNWNDFLLFLALFQKASKNWNGLFYFILNKGVFSETRLEEILDCMDCVIVFQWEIFGSLRHRSIHLQKARGVLSWLNDDQMYFMAKIDSQKGLIVTHQEKIKGRV